VAHPLDRPDAALTFDQLPLGFVARTAERAVEATDVEAFAALSGDRNPLHLDESFARRTPYRARIAHGMLVQSIATGLVSERGLFEGTTLGVLAMQLEFRSAVKLGERVHVELEVVERDPAPSPKRGWIVLAARVKKPDGELVIEGRWKLLMARRAALA
jgi:acyl dehydratase